MMINGIDVAIHPIMRNDETTPGKVNADTDNKHVQDPEYFETIIESDGDYVVFARNPNF